MNRCDHRGRLADRASWRAERAEARRRFPVGLRFLLIFFLVCLLLVVAFGLAVRRALAPAQLGRIHWVAGPGLAVEGVTIPNPPYGEGPYFLKAKRLTAHLAERAVTIQAPHLLLEPANLAGLGRWPGGPLLAFLPLIREGRLVDGRVEFADPHVNPERWLFALDPVAITVRQQVVSKTPVVTLVARGIFVAREGRPIGFAEADARFHPTLGAMEARLMLRHEQLRDFQRIYHFAPQPIWIEGGQAELTLAWTLTDHEQLRVTCHLVTQDLQLSGDVGGVPWARIVEAVADPHGRIELTAVAEGRLSDPTFDLHGRLLSELEWTVKERAAAHGVAVPDHLFFGLME